MGIGVQESESATSAASLSLSELERVWFFGLNPNSLGNYASLAVLFCIFLTFSLFNKKRKYLNISL